jgi:hypothetical protein
MTAPWIVAFVCLGATVIVLGIAVVGLLRKSTATLEKLSARLAEWTPEDMGGLPPGTMVPNFLVSDRNGHRHFAADVLDRSCLMLLLETGCEPCDGLVRDLWRAGWSSTVPLVVIVQAIDPWDAPQLPSPITVVSLPDLADALGLHSVATPQAFALDGARRVRAKSIPNATEHLLWLTGQLDEGGELRAGIGES